MKKNYNMGEKFYNLRKKTGLSQKNIAEILNISDGAISKWENGTALPSVEHLKKLSEIYLTTVDDLLTEDKKIKKVSKIVITGGPCAGKTTAFSWIQNKFTKEGYNVIFIPETASELIKAGVTPFNINTKEFQKILLELQQQKEQIYTSASSYLPYDKTLIVCDRGYMDSKAYMSTTDFRLMLLEKELSEVNLRDNYDAVFHLVTAANGAPEFYTLENNAARSESIEEAIEIDKKLIKAWTGHPHFRIIDNKTDFENKMKRLISCISHHLGEPEAYEIERKFLISMPDINKIIKNGGKKVEIIQTYLNCDKFEEEKRIRQRGENHNFIFSETIKKTVSNMKRIEIEKRLSEKEYLNLLKEANPKYTQIVKDRYCLMSSNNQYFEIDIYPFWNDKAIMEVELLHENEEIKIPKYLDVIEEVTDNPDYKNKNLALVEKKN